MTKDEAVQKLSKVARISVAYAEDLYDSFFPKPVVPQYVADWIEKNKGKKSLRGALMTTTANGKADDWLNQSEDGSFSNQEIFARAWLLGYEVEKEPKYTVRIKGVDGYSKYLNRDTKTQKWLFASKTELERFRAHHTRKELEEAGFDWVFNCPGVEVKEVE